MELIRFARGAAAALPFDDPIRHHVALDDFTQRQEARLWQDLAPRPSTVNLTIDWVEAFLSRMARARMAWVLMPPRAQLPPRVRLSF